MKSIRFRLLIAAAAVLLGTTIANSQTVTADAPPPPAHHHGMHGHFMRADFFPRALNLTDDQKTQMKAIMEKERPTMKPLFQQERQIDQQLRQFSEGAYDETKVRALATQKSQLEVEMTVAHTRLHNEMYQLLTTDQRTQLQQIEASHQARMQEHTHEAPPAPEQ